MNQRRRKGILKLVRLFAMVGTALLVSTGGKTYAQVHGSSSGSFGHSGERSASFHSAAVGHWGVPQHRFAYGGGHRSNRSPAWGHGRYGYARSGRLYSSGPRFYGNRYGSHAFYVSPPGHRPRYYFRRYNRPRN